MGIGRGFVVLLGALSACSLFVDLSGLSGGATDGGSSDGGNVDGSTADGSSGDGSIESGDGSVTDLTPHVLASVGDVPAETGNAQQQHLVYAINSRNWWIFYIDDVDTTVMKASVSTDFASWLGAAERPLSEPMATEGRNFALAYTNVAGKDIVHDFNSHYVAAEDGRDARSTITGATISYEGGIVVTQLSPFNTSVNPDGPNLAITGDGYVHIATGWDADAGDVLGRMNLFTSSIPDLGGTFNPTFPGKGSIASNGSPIQNRLLLPIAGGLLYLWPTAPTTTDTNNIAWSKAAGAAAPTAPQDIFGGTAIASQSINDWNACDVGGTVHFVRRTIDGGANDAFDDTTFNGTSWTSGAAMPKDFGKKDSGVVLASDGKTLLVIAIASDAANSVRATKLSGGAWSPWKTIVSSAATRNYLSASACGTSTHAAVIWTEGTGAPYRIEGVDVSSMF